MGQITKSFGRHAKEFELYSVGSVSVCVCVLKKLQSLPLLGSLGCFLEMHMPGFHFRSAKLELPCSTKWPGGLCSDMVKW